MDRCPPLDVLNVSEGKDFRKSVMQMSHMHLTADEFERALRALEDAFDESKGDIRSKWFKPKAEA